ncbi:MAG: hypothetical protein ACNA78_09905 [Balneolaceae bacterium]
MNLLNSGLAPFLMLIATIVCGFADASNGDMLKSECPDYTFALDEWNISERDGSFYINHLHEENLSQELYWNTGGPELSDVVGLGDDHIIIVYQSGSVGTSVIINTYRGLIFDIWEMSFIGDYPYRYEHQDDRDDTLTQPEWTLKEGALHIRDVAEGIDTVLKLFK